MVLAPYYRRFDLPWEGDPEANQRFRRLLQIGLALLLVFTIIVALVKLPPPVQTAEDAVPERLARLMQQEKPKPPPPPKPVEPPKPKPELKPQPVPKPEEKVAEARKKAERSLNRVRDELEDLRRDLAQELPQQTRNLTGAVGAESKAERSMIASKAGTGSSGVQSSNSSRGFGGGAGSLTGHTTTSVSSRVGNIGSDRAATRTGSSGKAARSQEEIELVFDRNRGAIDAIYFRALRERPELQGKMVLEFTISSTGEVTACRVVSSELNDPELERKIVARVKLMSFPARDVESITTTKPIVFSPG